MWSARTTVPSKGGANPPALCKIYHNLHSSCAYAHAQIYLFGWEYSRYVRICNCVCNVIHMWCSAYIDTCTYPNDLFDDGDIEHPHSLLGWHCPAMTSTPKLVGCQVAAQPWLAKLHSRSLSPGPGWDSIGFGECSSLRGSACWDVLRCLSWCWLIIDDSCSCWSMMINDD